MNSTTQRKILLQRHCWSHMSVCCFTMEDVGEEQQETPVSSHIVLKPESPCCECCWDAPSCPIAIGLRGPLSAWHPWSSVVRAWASHWWPPFMLKSCPFFFPSQGKALQMVPWGQCCAWSSPSWFPRLPQVQGWHWRMWWMSQLAWDGGSLCFEYV